MKKQTSLKSRQLGKPEEKPIDGTAEQEGVVVEFVFKEEDPTKIFKYKMKKNQTPESPYTTKERQNLYRGLVRGDKSTFRELYDMRREAHIKFCPKATDLDIIQTEIKIASKFWKTTEDPDLAEMIALYRDFLYSESKPKVKEIKNITADTLVKYVRDNAHQTTLDSVMNKCKDNLNGVNFDLGSYAALYMVIYDKYRNIFNPGTSFAAVQRMCDGYFSKDTHQYKPGKIKKKAEALKVKHHWIDTL
jgi:hypothetical protein